MNKELTPRTCHCVPCSSCHGNGTVVVWNVGFRDLVESCDDCGGTGITEICDSCRDAMDENDDPDRAWEISILGGNEMAEPKYRIFYTPQKPRTFLVLTMVNKSQTNKDYFKWRMRFLKIQVCKENVWRIPNEHKPS